MKNNLVKTSYLVLIFIFLFSCDVLQERKNETLIFLDGTKYLNPKVDDIGRQQNLKFEPYLGLYFQPLEFENKYYIVLHTKETQDYNGIYYNPKMTLKEVYQEVKDDNITLVRIHSKHLGGNEFWYPILDNYEKQIDLIITKEKNEKGIVWKYKNEVILSIKFELNSDFISLITLYPIKE